MRIDILHYAAPPIVGGVESVIAHHARLMVADGHQVRILAGRGGQFDERIPFISIPKADSRHPEIQSVKHQLDQGNIPDNFIDLVSELEKQLISLLKDTQVLIAHNVCSLHKNLPLTAALKRVSDHNQSLRLILWHHDLAWSTPRYQSELHEGYPWDLLRDDWIGVTQVVISEMRRRELADLTGIPEEDILVIPNGINFKLFLKLETQSLQLFDQLNLFSAAPLLLLPVRITLRKNIELALRVLAALRSKFAEAALVVTGPLGPHNPANVEYFNRLRQIRSELKLEGAAHFLAEHTEDFLPDEVIADFYRIADALLFPSSEEGFGIPILEAGLSGIPVFCAEIPALRELGRHDVSYFSLNSEPAEIATMIERLLTQNPVFGMRWRVRNNYSWEQIYRKHIAALLRI